MDRRFGLGKWICLVALALAGCAGSGANVGQPLKRTGDEIVIAGQFFHTGGAPVVTWMDPGGFDAYRTERRFVPIEKASFGATTRESVEIDSPNRYNTRFQSELTPAQLEEIRGGGWPLSLVQEKVDQIVYHYDVAACSRNCFRILHDVRGLSAHFLVDLDGTIYQTLDVKERAWHATASNSRSVGIEIANIGAYPLDDKNRTLDQWYRRDSDGKRRMVMPTWMKRDWIRTPGFVARPSRNEAIIGTIQNGEYRMYDLTPQQYDSLIKLTAALCKALPKINCDYPRDEEGKPITHVLPKEQLESYHGLAGHYHIQADKIDPGPAFDWDRLTDGARKLLK